MKQLTTPFEQNDLVWAKIQNYPWWPGRIIQIFEQRKTLIFKISFYADPTYSYLREDALIQFERFQETLNANYFITDQLRKAIDLANNAFHRKKQALKRNQNIIPLQSLIQIQSLNSQLEISDQSLEKEAEQFQQSTIHADFFTDNQNEKKQNQLKNVQRDILLKRYKLDKIPNFPQRNNQKKIMIEEQLSLSQSQSSQQIEIEIFQVKKRPRAKKTNKQRKIITKKEKVKPITHQEKKVKFMRHLCSLLIEKQLDSQLSRQITLKVMQKIDSFKFKNQTKNQEEFFLKYLKILKNIDLSMAQEQKINQIFNPIQAIFQEDSNKQKFEEEKTQTPYSNQ